MRGRGRGFSGRGGGGDRGGRGGFRGGRGGGRQAFDEGPPDSVIDLGSFVHPAESDMVCKCSIGDKVPYFNAPIFLENKTKIGKIDEVFGPINQVMFTVKPDQGVVATSFQADDKVYIAPEKLLPLSRFTEEEKRGGAGTKRKSMGSSGDRGGRGGGRGGRGGSSFGGRGGGGSRGRGGFSAGRGAPRGGGFRGRGR